MNDWFHFVMPLLVYVVIAIGSYMMGRSDENRRWADILYKHWKEMIDEYGEKK